jgi:hypothetical protein
MNVKDFLQKNAVADERFTRFNEFDSDRFDYTIQIQKPGGEVVTLRNPAESADGILTDKRHSIPEGSKLLAAGTAFWDWPAKTHTTVAIDIDTDDGHAEGLNASSFLLALEAMRKIPWFDIRLSSGGKGLHVFPRFTRPVEVSSRAEASALAGAVLTIASREAGFDLKAAKDCAGSNIWIYKKDAAPNAYEIIKEASTALDPNELPPGWREAKNAAKHKVEFAPSTIELSLEHLEIEKQIQSLNYSLIYVPEYGCYHIHTHALQEAYRKHGYRGYFATASQGTDPGKPNGYMFPLPGGGFLIKRFGNAKEDCSWFDGLNGQYALLNVEAPFDKAVQHFSVNKTTKGYAFARTNLEKMLLAIGVNLSIPGTFAGRTFFLKPTKGEAQIVVEKQDSDGPIDDWTPTGKTWQRSFPIPNESEAIIHAGVVRVSDVVRAVSTDKESSRWCISTDGNWTGTTASEISNVLVAHQVRPAATMGLMREKPYHLVFEPFQDEYLPERRWNRDAPQLACKPADEAGDTPTWDAVFNHIGSGLDDDVANDEACKSRGITSGAQYLKLWVKLLLEKPHQRTPYLFLTSRQNNTGKTSLGASICHLIDPGVAEINEEALVDKFTGELEGKVLCLIEELDLRDRRNKAYATLKRVLTSKTLTIRRMRTDTYNVPNFTHFIHTANAADFVPVESEDMRIVMIRVAPITNFIDSLKFEEGVKREAPAILRKLLDMPLPEPCGRFWLPVVQTSLKESVLSGIHNDELTAEEEGVQSFVADCLVSAPNLLVPTTLALTRYADYCNRQGLPKIQKSAFLSTLCDKLNMNVGKKQMRIEGVQQWHYTGIELKA